MITLEHNELVIRFPKIHKHAEARISFQRTLRIPDDGKDYPLPPGMGNFPLHHIEDYGTKLPSKWVKHGGIFMPMYQSEALWLSFQSNFNYPIALQISAGKINAINGEPWQEDMQFEPQGYVTTDQQPWIDGFCIEKGKIRQFVATPLGKNQTVEEQITGKAEFGGIQIKAWPLKAGVYEKSRRVSESSSLDMDMAMFCCSEAPEIEMGLAMGGSMKQKLYDDMFEPDDWDTGTHSRCFIHLMNSTTYAQTTGHLPPHRPYEASDYANAGMPWFDYYSDHAAIDGSDIFSGLKSWKDFQKQQADESIFIDPETVVSLGEKPAKGKLVSQGEDF